MIIAVIYLIGAFLSAAIYLIFIGLNFIGISYIIIYCGGIAILFLFVLMLINIDLLDLTEIDTNYSKNIPLVLTIASLFSYFFIILLPFNSFNFLVSSFKILTGINALFGYSNNFPINPEITSPVSFDQVLINLTQIEILGLNLYTDYALLIILISFVLLLALVAPILILGVSKPSSTGK